MAEDKTEEPTPKKLREARKRGEVARSRELGTAAVVLAAAVALHMTSAHAVQTFQRTFSLAWAAVPSPTPMTLLRVLEGCFLAGVEIVAPLLLAVLAASTVLNVLHVGPLWTFAAVEPKLERLDPLRGLQNLFGQRQWVELVKSMVKIVIIGSVAYTTLRDGLRGIVTLASRNADAALQAAGHLSLQLFLRVGFAMALVAVLDIAYQRWRFRKDQRMTRSEVKREHKESEGDPITKQQRERMHREILEHSVLEEVRRADVLVVNPTHVAVALRYDEEAGNEAPEVLAKGGDELARRMIEVAREAGVPVMRDVPLARALFDLEIGEEIPEVLYEAAAAVLRAAWKERADQ